MFWAKWTTRDFRGAENEFNPSLVILRTSHPTSTAISLQHSYNISHKKLKQFSVKPLHTNFIQHISCFMAHTILSQKVKYFSWSAFYKSKYKDFSSKYFFLTSTKSAHSIKICKIVVMLSNAAQTVGFSLKKKKKDCSQLHCVIRTTIS